MYSIASEHFRNITIVECSKYDSLFSNHFVIYNSIFIRIDRWMLKTVFAKLKFHTSLQTKWGRICCLLALWLHPCLWHCPIQVKDCRLMGCDRFEHRESRDFEFVIPWVGFFGSMGKLRLIMLRRWSPSRGIMIFPYQFDMGHAPDLALTSSKTNPNRFAHKKKTYAKEMNPTTRLLSYQIGLFLVTLTRNFTNPN